MKLLILILPFLAFTFAIEPTTVSPPVAFTATIKINILEMIAKEFDYFSHLLISIENDLASFDHTPTVQLKEKILKDVGELKKFFSDYKVWFTQALLDPNASDAALQAYLNAIKECGRFVDLQLGPLEARVKNVVVV